MSVADEEEEEEVIDDPLNRPITEVTLEHVELSCRDFISYAVYFFSFRRVLRALFWIAFFLSIGYGYKLWLWVDMCVLESSGVPCREDYSLLASPYPLNIGVIYNEEVTSSRSFFAIDWPHILCCFRGGTFVAMAASGLWVFKRYIFTYIRARVIAHKQQAVTTRRRAFVRKNK